MKKKFIIALWQHETNTFSPVKTTLASFGGGIGRSKPFSGIEALREFKGTKNPIGGFIDIAIREGAEIEIPLAAKAEPSGAMTSDAYETMANMLCDSVRGGCDAILLDLHGAMVAEGFDDGEGELLRRIRKIAPDVPIGVALDFHTNLTEDMMRNCTVIVGYKTYPHTDMYETAFSAGDLIVRTLKGEIRPIMVWDTRPMITHMLRQAIKEKPMSDLIKMAVDAEKCGDVLSASVFGGFPKSDVPHVSFSSVVIGDGKTERAKALCDTILNTAWDRRKEFVYDIEPLEKSIGRAKELREFPVLLIDHGDNCGAGGPQDDMTVVKEVMKQGLTDVAVGSICDPMAVEEMIKAGIGSKVTV
jgi:microcystin degradation protein MlrC